LFLQAGCPFCHPTSSIKALLEKPMVKFPSSDVEQKSGRNKSAIFYCGTTVFIEVPYEEF